jgi:hypothetical protein
MQLRLLKSLGMLALLGGTAYADSTLRNLPPGISPFPPGSCLYVDQAGVDTKLCGSNIPTGLGLAPAQANSIMGNWTSSAGNSVDNPMPSCVDAGNNHLNYVSGTGFVCGTTPPSPIPSFARTFASPADPAGNSTTSSPLMMGLGLTGASITPTSSGRLHFVVVGTVSSTSNNGACTVRLVYGTGTAPANQAASTGNNLGASKATNNQLIAEIIPYSVEGWISGLTVGTAVWFDVSLGRGLGTCSIKQNDVYAEEN